MDAINFEQLPLAGNMALFAAAAATVWVAGVKVTQYAKVIADRTVTRRYLE